jgi:hypothetical protein
MPVTAYISLMPAAVNVDVGAGNNVDADATVVLFMQS